MNQLLQKTTLLLLTIFHFNAAFAQSPHPTCNGTRYLTQEFSSVDTTFNVFFGANTTYQGNLDSLRMDIYQPVGDTAAARPLMILAFGGSFVVGVREDMAPLCHYYAQHGYVTATIDYRLFDGFFIPFPDSTVFADVVMKAIGDMKAAIRFFREDAATNNFYKIDPNMIVIGGGSAGAITALNVAYLDSTDNIPAHILTAINNNGGFEGNTTSNTQYSSEVQAVLNFSGALGSASWVDAGDAPVFSVHDDGDNIVPYAQGYAKIVNIPISYMEGSKVIADTATALGITNSLITIPNSTGHVTYVDDPLWQDSVFTSSCVFLHEIICPVVSNTEPIVQNHLVANFYPNPSSSDITLEINDLNSTYQVSVYDNMGRLVFQKQGISDNYYTFNKENFAAGMYFVNVQFEDSAIAPVQGKVVFQ